jgi:hypothetical protein
MLLVLLLFESAIARQSVLLKIGQASKSRQQNAKHERQHDRTVTDLEAAIQKIAVQLAPLQ